MATIVYYHNGRPGWMIGDQRTEIRKEKKNLPGCNYGTTDHHENGHFNSHRLCYTKFKKTINLKEFFVHLNKKTYPRI